MGWQTVKITADTNILVRAIVGDDARQSAIARSELAKADMVVVTLPALCELVWVLSGGYRTPAARIAEAIRNLVNASNVMVNHPAVEAGLDLLDAGGDFADGVIAFEGSWLGGEAFVSFDRWAVRLLSNQGQAARLPA
jgi:predicted nucleic-acid-binding protein